MGFMNFVKKHAPEILSVVASIGVVSTVILAIKGTNEVRDNQEQFSEENPDREMDREEVIQNVVLPYAPAGLCAAATIVCIAGSNICNRKQQASLMASCALLERLHANYREEVRKVNGDAADRMIQKAAEVKTEDDERESALFDEVQTFNIEGYDECFEKTMRQVYEAEIILNRTLALQGYVTLENFCQLLEIDPNRFPNSDMLGWDLYLGETEYGYGWIDIMHDERRLPNKHCVTKISFPFAPHPIFEEYAELDKKLGGHA